MTFDSDGSDTVEIDPDLFREAIESASETVMEARAEMANRVTDRIVDGQTTATMTNNDYDPETDDPDYFRPDDIQPGGPVAPGQSADAEYDPGEAEKGNATVAKMAPDAETAMDMDGVIGSGEVSGDVFEVDHTDSGLPADTVRIDIDEEVAERLLGVVYREKYEVEHAGFSADVLVLGVEQYARLEAWCQSKHGHAIDHRLPFGRIITVPGPMVHVVRPNMHMVHETFEEDG